MKKFNSRSLAAVLVWLLASAVVGAATAEPVETTVETTVETPVMSFNIRYGTASDGANRWELRRDLVMATIEAHEPALFGVQECLWGQAQELRTNFADFQMTAAGRNDGRNDSQQSGEMCAIFTRRDRYEVLEHGVFWLSETPDKVGSKGWDAALPRIATWVKLADKICRPDTVFVFNTHFDHVGAQARKNSAALLRTRMSELAGNHPVILMGDFNDSATSASPSYQSLMSNDDGLKLTDTWSLASRDQRMQGEGTFHGFSGEATRGRIDWILTSPDWPAIDAGIERLEKNGRYPSDHFPVWVIFRQDRR